MTTDNKRHLSLLDYLKTLQREFFISEIRSKFYYSPKDKQYYKRVASHKRDKILNISNQNNIKCIFNSDKIHEEVRLSIYPKMGLPNFGLTTKDIENYYSTGSDVKCFAENDEEILGKIVNSMDNFNKILVRVRGVGLERVFVAERVVRIFPH